MDIPNFYDSLKEFLKSKQTVSAEDFKENYYTRRGGTYYDDDIKDLIKSYFTTEDEDHSDTDFLDVSHYYDDAENEDRHKTLGIEDVLERLQSDYNSRMDYSEVYYYIDEDGGYFTQSGVTTIDISKFELSEDVENSFDNMRKLNNGEYDEDFECPLYHIP